MTSTLITRQRPTMYFFGVTTGQSSSLKLFPAWAELLGLGDAQLLGVDLPINAPPEMYREAVLQIQNDPLSLGALVTTHKLNVVKAAGDLFDGFSDEALLCNEVSCIYKRDQRLLGHATDPEVSGNAMARFIDDTYWTRHEADVLCLGAGGAALALAAYFVKRAQPTQRPRRMVMVDIHAEKLNNVRTLVEAVPATDIAFEFVHNADPKVNDALMTDLPPHSLVVNATGMGKDIPGSPITDAGVFPEQGIAWELNYRGTRTFMHQALAQSATRPLQIEDGWGYFLLGWSTIIAQVFNIALTESQMTRFADVAERIR